MLNRAPALSPISRFRSLSPTSSILFPSERQAGRCRFDEMNPAPITATFKAFMIPLFFPAFGNESLYDGFRRRCPGEGGNRCSRGVANQIFAEHVLSIPCVEHHYAEQLRRIVACPAGVPAPQLLDIIPIENSLSVRAATAHVIIEVAMQAFLQPNGERRYE